MIVMAKKWGYQSKVCSTVIIAAVVIGDWDFANFLAINILSLGFFIRCRPIIDLFYMYQVFCLHDGIILSVSLWVQKVINSIFSGLMSLRVRL